MNKMKWSERPTEIKANVTLVQMAFYVFICIWLTGGWGASAFCLCKKNNVISRKDLRKHFIYSCPRQSQSQNVPCLGKIRTVRLICKEICQIKNLYNENINMKLIECVNMHDTCEVISLVYPYLSDTITASIRSIGGFVPLFAANTKEYFVTL